MRTALRTAILVVLVAVALIASWSSSRRALPRGAKVDPELRARAAAQLMNAPLVFEPNRGQADAPVAFLSHGPDYDLRLDRQGASLTVGGGKPGRRNTVRLTLQGAATTGTLQPERENVAKVSYFKGSDQRGWLSGLPTYDRVRYEAVYPGVDLVFYGNQQRFEYDFNVAPGADARAIRVAFTGADRVELTPDGDLALHVGDRSIAQARPVAYQDIDGVRHDVASHYRMLDANAVAIDVDAYRHGLRPRH